MKKILFFITITGMINSWGQSNDEVSQPINYNVDMFPKTPEAASLGKFVDIPPGDYTGTAVFSIPLYNIEIGGMKLPIELNYSTTGVKVSEIASRVGLGWSLNVGGASLSKQVIGSPDAEDGLRPIISDTNFDADGTGVDPNDPTDPLLIAFKIFGLELYADEIPIDIKPDIYSYSLPTGNGKYILDSSGDFGIPIPYNQIKINSNTLRQEIIDEEGNIYTFSRGLGIKSYNSCNNTIYPLLHYPDPNYRITKIETTTNEEINFLYNKRVNAHYVTSMVEQRRLYFTTAGSGMGQPQPVPPKCYNRTKSDEDILTQINFPEGSVYFKYNDETIPGSEREDLPGDYYLTKVIVKDLNGKTVKEVNLQYSYFTSPNAGSYSGEIFEGINKRLKLVKVTDNYSGGEYNLSYYENQSLPHRLSNSQDFWGVYNGKPNTESSIPTTVYKNVNVTGEPRHLFLGANKQPDIDYGITGNLKRLTYPTGGYTEIEYEPDDYYQTGDPAPPSVFNYTYKDAYASSTQSSPEQFNIANQPYEMKIEFTGDNDDGSGVAQMGNCHLSIYLGTNPTPVFESDQYNTFHKYDSFETGSYTINITPGYDIDTSETVDCTAVLRWYEEELVNDSPYRQTGTIRVKKILSHSSVTGEILREFTYLDPDTNYTQTSGKNLGDECFAALYTKESPFDRNGTSLKEIMLSNNPGWQISTVRGKPIGYDYVQEIYKSSTESFKKEYKFMNDTDDAWTTHNPYSVINYTWPIEGTKRGLKLYEKSFDKDNQLKQMTEYEYNFDTHFNELATTHPVGTPIVAYGLEINWKSITCTDLGCYYVFDEEVFPIKNYWITDTVTTTREYKTPTDFLETKKSTRYSIPQYKHTYPTEIKITGSNSETLTTEYQYPQDLIGIEPNMSTLKNANRLSTPVITESYMTDGNGTQLVSSQKTEYALYQSETLLLPKFIYLKKGEQSFEKKIIYDRYDDKGNLEQYTLENGTVVSIIWGYNKQYPIAKIEGLAYASIPASLITNAVNASNADANESTETTLRAKLEDLRKHTNLANAVVTTYTYDPLVGVTTVIAPNGQESFYKYDAAGRLDKILDKDSKVLKKMDYHYYNQ